MRSARLTSPRMVAILVWITGFVVYSATVGLPTKRGNVLIWVALAVLALGWNEPRRTLRSFLTIWLPFFAGLAMYDLLRGASHGAEADAHTWPQLDLDLWLGGGATPTEHLQAWLWHAGDPHWWDTGIWIVYQSHFLVPLLVPVVLWAVGSPRALPYILGLIVLVWMALLTYWLYPAQPPWMTARDGLTGEVTRIVKVVWADIGVERAERVFTTAKGDGSRYSNTVAALPSLHAALPMFIAVMLWGVRRWLDVVLVLYVAAMGFTLVYAGEHFTFDLLLGWAYALVVALGARRIQKMRTSRNVNVRPEPQASTGLRGSDASAEDALVSSNR